MSNSFAMLQNWRNIYIFAEIKKRFAMGLYLNPGNSNFVSAFNSKLYVDKSLAINVFNQTINTESRFVCLSRARRFGKTMLQNMIAAYYSKGCDSKEYFSQMRIARELSDENDIEKFHKNMNSFNVLQLDFNGFWHSVASSDREDFFNVFHSKLKTEFIEEFPEVDFSKNFTVAECIASVYLATKQTFIILIDEYDFFVREKFGQEMFKQFLDFLISLFKNSPLKPAISLAYITGILPVVRDRIQSKLNNIEEYTMVNAFAFKECIGFTYQEVEDLCKKHNLDFQEVKRWYDGYTIDGTELFNANSVIQAIENHCVKSYVTTTGSFDAITDYIKLDFEGIRDDLAKIISGQEVKLDVSEYLNTLTDFNSKDDVFTYLIHLGYLGYNSDAMTCYIPNFEVRREWMKAVKRLNNFGQVPQIIRESETLLEATIYGEEQMVADSLERSHSLVMSNWQYNNEACFGSAIKLSFIAAYDYYTIFQELPTGKGYADLVFIPYKCKKPALIIELKVDTVVETAISQIYDKKYNLHLEQYKGNMRFIGISYNRETKKHTCKIEEW